MISMNRPKMDSRPCEFLLHSPLLMLLTHIMSITHRDILHPVSPTTNLGELHQASGYRVHDILQNSGCTKQNYQENYNSGKYSFPQSPLIYDRAKVQKGMFSFDIAFSLVFQLYVIPIDTGHIALSPQSSPRWSPAFKVEPVLSVSSFISPS